MRILRLGIGQHEELNTKDSENHEDFNKPTDIDLIKYLIPEYFGY